MKHYQIKYHQILHYDDINNDNNNNNNNDNNCNNNTILLTYLCIWSQTGDRVAPPSIIKISAPNPARSRAFKADLINSNFI